MIPLVVTGTTAFALISFLVLQIRKQNKIENTNADHRNQAFVERASPRNEETLVEESDDDPREKAGTVVVFQPEIQDVSISPVIAFRR